MFKTNAYALLLPMIWLAASCSEPAKPSSSKDNASSTDASTIAQADSATVAARLSNPPVDTEQISQYVRRIFQDRDGNLWFGTTSDGVARWDPSASLRPGGRALDYFTPANGFGSNWVSAMAQDARGDIWFATGGGISRYNGRSFTNYTKKHGLASDQVWSMLLDKNGGFWFGTEEGVSRYDGTNFNSFPIPAADLSKYPYYNYPNQINAIVEDKAGNIWFASNGGGVYRYDGTTLTNLSEKDGLCNNFVETILEDRAGNLWFGTRYGGLCKYDPSASLRAGGKAFTAFSREDLKGDHIWTLYQGSNGIIWIAVARSGLCSYDGATFTCYDEGDGAGIRVVQSIFEDANGQLWFGTSNGVYRFDGKTFTNWTKKDAAAG